VSLTPYWATFMAAPARCVEATNIEAAHGMVATHGRCVSMKRLPSRLCVDPSKCAGRASCPKPKACVGRDV